MKHQRSKVGPALVAALLIASSFAAHALAADAAKVDWVGKGPYRLLVRVAPGELAGRDSDERPAELAIDFATELERLGVRERTVDIASIQVVPYDPETGRARQGARYAYALGEFDAPFHWYDGSIPYDFPEVERAVSSTQGKLTPELHPRGGYVFNALGDWRAGRLVWMHVQSADRPTAYAVYFDLLPAGAMPRQLPPAAWVGDGTPRRDLVGQSSLGSDHSRVDVTDWNGDGLVDLVIGEQSGHVFWWPNLGTKSKPEFRYGRFVFADGAPLDAGEGSAPKVVDWDADGADDMLVGTHWNRTLYYRNTGSNQDRRLEYTGPLMIDGEPLALPIAPLERGSPDIFKRDYQPTLETVDWDGDGDIDLLAGGYITGRIYWYENHGKSADGVPRLKLIGPLEADDKPINVHYWCAAPTVADFDGDGDLDLVTGNFPNVDAAERAEHELLQYYENTGTRTNPQLASRPFPGEGVHPHAALASPRATDWDGDGDLDLVESARDNLYLFENVGSARSPRFRLSVDAVKVPWGLADLPGGRLLDWNRDGRLDLVYDYRVRLNTGSGNPFAWERSFDVLPAGQYIEHPSRMGDDWFMPYLDDFDTDGRIDVLFGDWWGNVWFHRNLSDAAQARFDMEGFRFKLASGELIKVGPIGKDPAKDFDALQGARTVFTVADFDHDGLRDLVIGDTYGKIRYFRKQGARQDGSEPMFDDPIEIDDVGIRGLVDAADWNRDGWPDVVASAANGRVHVILNRGEETGTRFALGVDPKLPPIMQPRVVMGDLNGDGDDDLFMAGLQGAIFVERSFLEHGYARAELVGAERREP